uniref:Uncharacterized protein n=1 Tax=Ditylenchus dipsaci TaxID=166011 RepID=A0A915DD40_9BILA
MIRTCIILCATTLLFSSVRYTAADVIDQLARQSKALIAEAAIQASTSDNALVMGCIDTCWDRFQEITSHPADLRKCFSRTDSLLEELMTCFEQNVDACLDERAETMIQKINITELFRLGVIQIEKTKTQLTKNVAGPIKKILDTAGNFGICVKDCFVGKNAHGFCFDSKDCQPLLADKKAKKSLRQCTKLIDWKKEAGELCDCSVKAGLSDLHDYCPMLRLIGGGRRQPNISG